MRAGGIPRWLSSSLLLLLLVGSYAEIPETEVGTPEQAEIPKAEVGGVAPVGTSPQELYEYGMKLAGKCPPSTVPESRATPPLSHAVFVTQGATGRRRPWGTCVRPCVRSPRVPSF